MFFDPFVVSVITLVAVFGGLVAQRLLRRVVIFEYERGLLFRRGRVQCILEPGVYWHMTLSSSITRLDIRPRFVSISGQEILTADQISLKISLAAQYAIADPHRAVLSSQSYHESLYLILQLALRAAVSSVAIDDLLANRQTLGERVLELTTDQLQTLGLQLLSVQIKDITFPGDLKRMFAQVVKAQKEGLAALEKARGESAALRNLANAAKMLDNNPSLLQLRALLAVSESSGNTVVFTVPSVPALEPGLVQRKPGTTGGSTPTTE